jgi:hypothetical protein
VIKFESDSLSWINTCIMSPLALVFIIIISLLYFKLEQWRYSLQVLGWYLPSHRLWPYLSFSLVFPVFPTWVVHWPIFFLHLICIIFELQFKE